MSNFWNDPRCQKTKLHLLSVRFSKNKEYLSNIKSLFLLENKDDNIPQEKDITEHVKHKLYNINNYDFVNWKFDLESKSDLRYIYINRSEILSEVKKYKMKQFIMEVEYQITCRNNKIVKTIVSLSPEHSVIIVPDLTLLNGIPTKKIVNKLEK